MFGLKSIKERGENRAKNPENFFTSETAGINIKDLNLWYSDFHALKNVNMQMDAGKITALIGPSGCGKSTLVKTLNRMNDLVEGCRVTGSIDIGGINPFDPNVDISLLRKNIGMVFQRANPFPMSIYDNVAYAPRTFGIKKRAQLDEIVEKSLTDAVMWDEVKDRLAVNALGLSGGQQQRLCIARTLAAMPRVILMDEPTSALDPISTSKIEELCLSLKGNYTIVIVTHNMQQAERIADNTAYFLLGEMIELAPTKDIFNSPKDKRTHNYISGKFG